MRFVLFVLCLAAQAQPTVRTANVLAVLKPQGRGVWTVTLDNQSAFPVQMSRAKLLAAAPSVSQQTKAQLAERVGNSAWAVAGRSAQEAVTIAPAALAAAGAATRTNSLGWYGLGISLVGYFVQRATAHTQVASDELPETIPLAASGGGEYRLHASTPRGAVPVTLRLEVLAP